MTDKEKVITGLEELSGFLFKEYGKAKAEEANLYYGRFLTVDNAIDLLKEQEGYVSVPFSWLVKFCTHIDFNEPMCDADREKLWKQKLKQQFDIDIPC